MKSRWLLFVSTALAFMTAILLLDRPGVIAQVSLGLATATFLWCFAYKAALDPRQILTTIAIATTGEVVLSMGWGLYVYKNALIPLYVPPGHAVFYALAVVTARERKLQEYATGITRAVLIFGTLYAAASFLFWHDTWGLLWWLAACILIIRSENQLLLSACFVYTILLEWVGTAIGNWRWLPEVPFLSVSSANPPAGVTVLYVLLDLLTVTFCAILWREGQSTGAGAAPVPSLKGAEEEAEPGLPI
ncbi:MAG: hypothetical protein HY282_09600 [Nitrospirae bacterium]|nr:hypothetical protein [Candidatus Manganitrophaceae bacterium]